MRATLKSWIEGAAGGEPVEAVVLGDMGYPGHGLEKIPEQSRDAENWWGRVLTWEQAIPFISYEFDAGFGAPGCQAITAWTASRVIFVVQYDGATSIHWVPRNPVDYTPEMPGG